MRVLLVCTIVLVITSQQPPPTPPVRPPSTPPPGSPQSPPPQRSGRLPRERSATGEALDRYFAGQYDDAIARLSLLGGFNVRQAEDWIRATGPQAVANRRLAAATMALEYTASRPGLSPTLIEWARDMTSGVAPEWQPVWLRASIALAEGSEAWSFLTPTAPPAPGRGGKPAREGTAAVASGYLADARTRFPENPHVKLAEAVGLEFEAYAARPSPLSRRASGPVAFDQIEAEMLDGTLGAPDSAPPAPVLRAVGAFESLLSDQDVGAEAHLRAGYSRLRLGELDRAREHFARAVSSSDPFVKYLAHLYDGWSLARQGRADEAAKAYRAALDVLPRARSAATLLTSVLFMNHRLADAEAVATEFMSGSPAPDDPLRAYRLGDYRSYRGLIGQLREAIK